MKDWDKEDKEFEDMDSPVKCTNCGETKPKVLFTNPLGKPKGICDQCATAKNPKWLKDLERDDLDESGTPTTSTKAEKIPTANPADGCPYCEYDKSNKEPCPDCGEQHDNEKDFKNFLEHHHPDAHPLDIKDNIGAYLAHKKQPDMVHNQHFALLTGDKTRGRKKRPDSWGGLGKSSKSCPFCKDFAALTADHPMKIDNLVNLQDMHDRNPEAFHKKLDGYIRSIEKSYISKLYDTDGCIYCKTNEIFKKRKIPTHKLVEEFRQSHHRALNSNPEYQKMSKEQRNEQLAAVEHDVKVYEIHGRKPNDVHDMIDHVKRERKIDEKNAATMAVSSPEEGKTCNCETGDHSNAGGQEHGMFNQDIGRQNWQGQGLPQPKQDKDSCQCDEKPVEANKVPNADARLGDDEMKEEKKKTDVCPNCGKKRKGKKTQQILSFLTQPPDIYPSEIDGIGDDEDEKKKAYCQCNKVYDKHGKELKIVNPLQAARPTGGKTGKDFLPDAAKIDEKVETYYGHIPESKVGGKHNAPPHKQSKGDKWMSRHYTPEALQEHERTTYDPDLAEKLTANKADDDEQITGTSTGAKKTPNPKKYLHKPSEHNPMGVINPQWTDWRAARRKQLKEGKRETDSKKLLENMSAGTKLNLQTQAKLISAGTQSINDQKRSEQNKKRKKMTKQQLAARRKRLLGKAILKIKAMLERLKISDDDVVRETSGGDWNINPNREIVGAKDEADRKRRAQGLGGKGGCRGVGCDNKATKKLIGHVRDHLSGSTQDKPLSSTREHKEIINVCPDCYKKWKKYQKDQKRRGNTAKTERGDGTWGMRGLGEGQGTTDIQGSGETYLISPVKQEELNRLMAGARYLPRSVSRKKKP